MPRAEEGRLHPDQALGSPDSHHGRPAVRPDVSELHQTYAEEVDAVRRLGLTDNLCAVREPTRWEALEQNSPTRTAPTRLTETVGNGTDCDHANPFQKDQVDDEPSRRKLACESLDQAACQIAIVGDRQANSLAGATDYRHLPVAGPASMPAG